DADGTGCHAQGAHGLPGGHEEESRQLHRPATRALLVASDPRQRPLRGPAHRPETLHPLRRPHSRAAGRAHPSRAARRLVRRQFLPGRRQQGHVGARRARAMILSRVADGLYWMGRYLERAENTTRLLLVSEEIATEVVGLDEEVARAEWRDLRAIFPGGDDGTAPPDDPGKLAEATLYGLS